MRPEYPDGHYVYQLLDPRTGLPFYVGKGQRDRAWQHERDVRRGVPGYNAGKIDRIQEIIAAGLTVVVCVVQEYASEREAYEHEIELISALPCVLNIQPGGGPTILLPPEEAERRLRARAWRLLQEKRQARVSRHAHLEARRSRFLEQAETDQHRAEITKWLAKLPGLTPRMDHDPALRIGKARSKSRASRARAGTSKQTREFLLQTIGQEIVPRMSRKARKRKALEA